MGITKLGTDAGDAILGTSAAEAKTRIKGDAGNDLRYGGAVPKVEQCKGD